MIASTFDVAFDVVVVIASNPNVTFDVVIVIASTSNVAFDVVLDRFDASLEIDSKQIQKLVSIGLLEKPLKMLLLCEMF